MQEIKSHIENSRMHGGGCSSKHREVLRDRIITAAMRAFASKGIKAVKMDDIAHQLNISKRTLYEVFDNKELLLYEGVKKYKTLRQQEMEQIGRDSQNVMEIVLKYYRIKMEEFKVTSPAFYADLYKYPSVLAYLEADKTQAKTKFVEFLQRGVQEGYFRSDINYDLVHCMFDAVSHVIMNNQLYKQYAIDGLFRNILFVSLRGICTGKGVTVLDQFLETRPT